MPSQPPRGPAPALATVWASGQKPEVASRADSRSQGGWPPPWWDRDSISRQLGTEEEGDMMVRKGEPRLTQMSPHQCPFRPLAGHLGDWAKGAARLMSLCYLAPVPAL